MGVYLDRYLSGECQPVWDELVRLGAAVREEPLYGDALAVARETMRRARANIETLILRLRELGYEFGYGWAISRGALSSEGASEMEQDEPPHSPSSPDVAQLIEEIERRAGTLPLSLRAFYEIVGGVNFVGSHPSWEAQRLDPLEILSAGAELRLDDWMHWSDEQQEDGSCELPIAPDEYHKYFVSGNIYTIHVPALGSDAMLDAEWQHTTFVNYLRECFRWGGFPGWARLERRPEEDLAFLTHGLLPL